MNKPEFAYIGRAPCGCVVAITADRKDKRTADNVHEFILDELTIERYRVDTPELNAILEHFGCEHDKQKRKAQPALF
jgi:hypothetical protein